MIFIQSYQMYNFHMNSYASVCRSLGWMVCIPMNNLYIYIMSIPFFSEILMTISDIILGNKCIEHWQSGHLSPEITSGLSLEVRRLNWLQREAVLRSLRMIVHPGLRVINTAALNLGACIVEQITGFLPELTQLTELNLGSLNCRNNNLLTACNPFPGWEFQLLPNLSRVSLTGLSAAALQSLCLFSTNLSSLELINTDVNDDGIASICRLKKLEHFSSSCEGGHVISPYGFAELLRNLPELRKDWEKILNAYK